MSYLAIVCYNVCVCVCVCSFQTYFARHIYGPGAKKNSDLAVRTYSYLDIKTLLVARG